MNLLLFDIDGTLLTITGLDKSAVRKALADVFGRPLSFDGISFSGKTDPQIFREIVMLDIQLGGEFAGTVEDAITETLEAYKEAARGYMPTAGVRGLPGAVERVQHFHEQEDVQLGLVTGNVQEMAYLKLSQINLDGYFPFGAFGCDAEERNELPPFALQRATTHTGQAYSGNDVIVVGDTPRDIECGKCIGATTVAVATGHFSVDELAAHEPDIVLETLEDFQIP